MMIRLPKGRLPALLGIVLLAVLPFLRALHDDFVFDDRVVIVKNEIITNFQLQEIITRPYWYASPTAALYRPLTTLTYAVDFAVGGGTPLPFVVTNILCHALAALLVLLLLRRLFPDHGRMAWFVAALFAVHPIHVEAVAGIAGRSELLAAVLVLLCYLVWLRGETRPSLAESLLAPLLWFGALLAKESAIMLPLILFLHRCGWLPGTRRKSLRAYDLGWIGSLLLALVLRIRALGGLNGPGPDRIDNPLAHIGPIERFLGAGGVLARQVGQVLTGMNLSADYSYAAILPGPSLYLAGALTFIAAAVVIYLTIRKARDAMVRWGLLFFLVFWFLTSNVLLPIGTAQADRLLYLPLLGLLAFAVPLLVSVRPLASRPRLAASLLVVLVILGAARSADRTRVWRDERTLYESAVRDEPMSIKARWNLAVVMLDATEPPSARGVLDLLEPVARWAPNHGEMLQRQAVVLMFLGASDQADSLFRAALQAGATDSVNILIELGNFALQRSDGEAALAEFERAARTHKLPQNVAIGRASALNILGRYSESAEAWRLLLQQLPDSIPVRIACAVNLREAGDLEESIRILEEGRLKSSDPRLVDELAQSLAASTPSSPPATSSLPRMEARP